MQLAELVCTVSQVKTRWEVCASCNVIGGTAVANVNFDISIVASNVVSSVVNTCNNTPCGGGGKTVRTDHGGSSPTYLEMGLEFCTEEQPQALR